jgi:hypothetical protein
MVMNNTIHDVSRSLEVLVKEIDFEVLVPLIDASERPEVATALKLRAEDGHNSHLLISGVAAFQRLNEHAPA